MEMLDSLGANDHVSLFEYAHLLPVYARATFALGNDEHLSGGMRVPKGTGPGFKNHVGTGYRQAGTLLRQGLDLHLARKNLVAAVNHRQVLGARHQLRAFRDIGRCRRADHQRRTNKSKRNLQHCYLLVFLRKTLCFQLCLQPSPISNTYLGCFFMQK